MSRERKYSLWLMPGGRLYDQLHSLIKQLSKPYDTPEFEPHVTLLSGVKADADTLVSLTSELASCVHTYQITLDRIDHHNTYYQCLFIHVLHSAGVMQAHAEALRIFNIQPSSQYMPHLSLMYGDIDLRIKQKIIQTVEPVVQRNFIADSIHVYTTSGPPEQWSRIAQFVLRQ